MPSDHIKKIEEQIKEYRALIAKVAAPKPHEELLAIIHRPGWTTVAEGALVSAMLESMSGTARVLEQMTSMLVRCAGDVKAK